jgi:hypothetical protein
VTIRDHDETRGCGNRRPCHETMNHESATVVQVGIEQSGIVSRSARSSKRGASAVQARYRSQSSEPCGTRVAYG